MAPSGGGNIKVVVRVRPFNGRGTIQPRPDLFGGYGRRLLTSLPPELDRRAKCVVQMKGTQTVLIPPPDSEERLRSAKASKGSDSQKVFAFDKSYWSFDSSDPHFAGQDSLFNDLGAPLLDNAFQGYNNCIFAYGQTGSGKSYSMMGYGEEAGVIPKICRNMFERITEIQKDKLLSCTVEVSYLEIYNERVRDLLNPSTKGNLKVREHPSTGPYVEDLAKLVVRNFLEIENLMDEGNKARTVAATNMNETSSRSHAVFTLTLSQKRHDVETSMDTEKVAKISLVDLAGSERATSTGATGARLKEGAEINRSLSTLGRVIAALADLSVGKKKNISMVPYRDSILTWLLKDSLGGNSLTAMIAAISPADINFEETLSTLRYADSAKRIKNHAVVNEDPNARMIRELKEELAQLRSKLGGAGSTSGDLAEGQYPSDTPLEKQFVSITQADGTFKKVSKAEIAEQLNQSEKLYKDLNQTWEQKLQKTEMIHKEREAALEELGISIEKGFVGLSTPKKMPHLVNLSDDPLLAECLIYNIKPGITMVGNVDSASATSAEIRLNGSKILQEHCTFENIDGKVTVVPKEGAALMVNGLRIDKAKRLRSGYRVILGDFHIFRFNHPQEARAERAEQSLLRHTVTASQLGSPAPRASHDRNASKAESELEGDYSRPESPMPLQRTGRDSDWSFARREAANAILGRDISNLPDDELDHLFDDVQRARAVRRGLPENRLYDDDDLDSMSSYPVRDKYMSNGTMDSLSFDTAITMPGTPQHEGENEVGLVDDKLQLMREDMVRQLEKQKEEFQEKLEAAAISQVDLEEVRGEKERMENALTTAREEFQMQLQQQREAFQAQLQQSSLESGQKGNEQGLVNLNERELRIARSAIDRWRQRRYVLMAGNILQYTAMIKEAQVMSQALDKSAVLQFVIIGVGHNMASSYDLVLNGVSGDDDEALEKSTKPCVGVRVIDYKNSVINVWSLDKLRHRVRLMRQIYQYVERPDYLQHFRLENPFVESCQRQYSLIGDVVVPLTAVFEFRVQDFALDVISPYTHDVIGIIRVSLEPSSAQAPSSTLKFNVVVHDMVGFAEHEGTDVHAQLYVPGVSDEGGASATQTIKGFDEGVMRFESVHSMSLPQSSPRSSLLRIGLFARVTAIHLDKLLSWDDIRDPAEQARQKSKNQARLAEREFHTEEVHDVFARVQILELSETGQYVPVEVVQNNALDTGAHQLHQGLQRRIWLCLTYSSTEMLQCQDVASLRVGTVRLLDPNGKTPDLASSTPDLALKVVQEPMVEDSIDGTCNITLVGQWDSSLHESLLLDRVTAEKYRAQIILSWDVTCARLEQPMVFSLPLSLQVRPRNYVRAQPFFQIWSPPRITHSTVGVFSVNVRPKPAKRTMDLWRMDSQYDYIKGEELLTSWSPRGVSLVLDYIDACKRRQRVIEIEAARVAFSGNILKGPAGMPIAESGQQEERQELLLHKFLNLWVTKKGLADVILKDNTKPPANGSAFAPNEGDHYPPHISAEVHHALKNPSLLKAGYLLMPDNTNTRWVRRFVELRRPYLHVYSAREVDELSVINLKNSRIDHRPEVKRLLTTERVRPNVFAIYAPHNTYLFAARNEVQKVEWILKIDQSYFSSESGSGEDM